ncbi:MAG: LITAF-like zinc ribbon domain-containing protein [Planctomycetaceae bacterium]|nr:LITAF-like zinc ribbon domain-containing protein [Planctomycetaceae bacterium]
MAGSPRFHCPFCGSSSPPNVRKKVSTAGWAVFIALLFACFLFAPLALLIRDERRYCRDCGLGLD